MNRLPKLWSGGNAYDPADDWLVDLANRQHAEIEKLKALHAEICGELYGEGYEIAYFHRNGNLQPLDSWFEENGWLDLETWEPSSDPEVGE